MGKKRRKPRSSKANRRAVAPVKESPVIEPRQPVVAPSTTSREVLAMRLKIEEMEREAVEAKRREENYLKEIGSPNAPKDEPIRGSLRTTVDGLTSPAGKMVVPHPETSELDDRHVELSGINIDYLIKEGLVIG